MSVPTTGPLEHHTFDPVYVTAEIPGHRREVRPLDYEWSLRNLVMVVPTLTTSLGFWSRQARDLHLVLPSEP